jgi:hypothetical protein
MAHLAAENLLKRMFEVFGNLYISQTKRNALCTITGGRSQLF